MTPNPEQFIPLTHVAYHVLLALTDQSRHGYGIIKHVEERTNGRLELEAGTLYAVINRLRDDTLIAEAKAPPGTDSRRRYYGLTPFGGRVLKAESLRLAELVAFARDAQLIPPGA